MGLATIFAMAEQLKKEKGFGGRSNPGIKPDDFLPQHPMKGPPLPKIWGIKWPSK